MTVAAADHGKTSYFRKHFSAIAFAEGYIRLRVAAGGGCEYQTGPTTWSGAGSILNLAVNIEYAFILGPEAGGAAPYQTPVVTDPTAFSPSGTSDTLAAGSFASPVQRTHAVEMHWLVAAADDAKSFKLWCSATESQDVSVVTTDAAATHTEAVTATTYFNRNAFHAAPQSLGLIDNIIFQRHTGKAGQISTYNCPLPASFEDASDTQARVGFDAAANLAIGLGMLTAVVILQPLTERVNNAKHVQVISGLTLSAYWIGNFLWDMIRVSASLALVR